MDFDKRLTRDQIEKVRDRIEEERDFLKRYKVYTANHSPILVDQLGYVVALRPAVELIDYKKRDKTQLWVAVEAIKKNIEDKLKNPFIDCLLPRTDRRHLAAMLSRDPFSQEDWQEFRDQVLAILGDSFSRFYEIADHEHYLQLNLAVAKKTPAYRLKLTRKEVFQFIDSLSATQRYSFPKNAFFSMNGKAKREELEKVLEKGYNRGIRNWRDWLVWKKMVLARGK